MEASVNGITYKASTQIVLPSASVLTDTSSSNTYNPSVASNGSYVNGTYTNASLAPYSYQYLISQINITSSGEEIEYAIVITSKSTITTGTYL